MTSFSPILNQDLEQGKLPEVLQKQESKTRQEERVQTNSSTWPAEKTSGQK